ncbi:BEL1-like homeodomain protein 9 [Zingiber officinale]|uniref:Homeobox domain-containing protein n=1 Tax=Zingiber officinale TaxID=94328 RepID=A0A8J5G8P3_ZINOF|nr:BEL1-like homeodomain protein 9 [Zingiber officinale]KAG6498004.1 hypothetical protein ZIOFF_045910 [Zingiber officinale]
MASSAADRFGGGGGGAGAGDEQLLLLHHHHHPQMYYHVPQYSRREKLRFPSVAAAEEEEASPASRSLLVLHEPGGAAAPIYSAGANSLTAFHSASTSPSIYHNNYGSVAQFDGHGVLPVAPPSLQGQRRQIPTQGFSLSLSSSPSARPRSHLAGRPAPLGPFTGYAAVLNRSRFLQPARRLLEEACQVGPSQASADGGGSASRGACQQELLLDADPPPREPALVDDHGMDDDVAGSGSEHQWKKTTLISMLDEVCRRYKQYYQQVQDVITSFESVAGLSSAAPYASIALKIMSKHFRCLKNIISDQLHQVNKSTKATVRREDISSFGLLNNTGFLQRPTNITDHAALAAQAQPHIWRPQRGLPERAVSVLRAWLFEHFLHPYPTDVDKHNLAKQTGLTRNQVSNWFINARVRLWKPMVEEIHSLDMRQKNKTSSHQPQPSSSNFPYSDVPSSGVNISPARVNVVSLTLGLQNDSGARFAGEPLPVSVASRFGLEECNDPYLVRAFGKDRLLHDFVG